MRSVPHESLPCVFLSILARAHEVRKKISDLTPKVQRARPRDGQAYQALNPVELIAYTLSRRSCAAGQVRSAPDQKRRHRKLRPHWAGETRRARFLCARLPARSRSRLPVGGGGDRSFAALANTPLRRDGSGPPTIHFGKYECATMRQESRRLLRLALMHAVFRNPSSVTCLSEALKQGASEAG